MRTTLTFLMISVVLIASGCVRDKAKPSNYYTCPVPIADQQSDHPLADRLQAFADSRVTAGVPGLSITVHDPVNGRWSGVAGRAELIGDIPLETCHVTRVGSTVKTYTAVAVLLLWERGLIGLDDPITKYLREADIAGIANAEEATVRQLLQHSSGMDNYIRNLNFQTASLNNFTHVWQPDELLAYSRGVPAQFATGTDVGYSNTGYILLGRIIESVTGEPFYHFFDTEIIAPLQLRFTSFAAPDPVPDGIIRGYIDMYDNGELIDATHYSGWDYFTADGGLLSNPYDMNRFLQALFDGELIGPEALAEMTDWQYPNEQENDAFRTGFGLGIFAVETEYGVAYLHSGDAVGYFATMVHFPAQGVTITWAANGNYGSLDQYTQTKEVMEEVFGLVLE